MNSPSSLISPILLNPLPLPPHPSGGSQSGMEKSSYILKPVQHHCDRGDSMVTTALNPVTPADNFTTWTTIHDRANGTRPLQHWCDRLGIS